MNSMLRVEITEQERKELDEYLTHFPHGQISHILRQAIKEFIKREKEKEAQLKKETQDGCQSGEGRRAKKTSANPHR